MEKTIRKFTSHEEARAETYRYWHGRPDGEVFDAIAEMSELSRGYLHPSYAFGVRAQPRVTKDLDIWIKLSRPHASAGYAAHASFGATLRNISGVPARYISADDLITNKLASGRLQDFADVEAIRQARAAVNR
jgi:hypothetical protein